MSALLWAKGTRLVLKRDFYPWNAGDLVTLRQDWYADQVAGQTTDGDPYAMEVAEDVVQFLSGSAEDAWVAYRSEWSGSRTALRKRDFMAGFVAGSNA